MSNSKLTLQQRLYDVEVGIDSLSVKEDDLYNKIEALKEERNNLKLVIEEKRKLKAIIKAEIEIEEKKIKKPINIDDENLEKYKNLVKEYEEASKKSDKFFYEKKSLHGGLDSLSPEDRIIHDEQISKQNELYRKYKKMEENELNKPKEITINNKKYKVCQTYESYLPERAIIVGETDKMYKLQYIKSKCIGYDEYQSSYYIYDYPKSLENKLKNKKKDSVKILKMYESDEYYTCIN